MTIEQDLIPLDDLVELRTEKAGGRKDRRRRYVGLEHMAQASPMLLGTAPGDFSSGVNCVFEADDILFGKLRPNLRKSLLAPFAGYCSTDILVLRAREGVVPSFAAHVFQWERVFAAAVRTAAGTKMPRTSWSELRRTTVVRERPRLVQTRIAEVLNLVDAAIERTAATIAKLKQLRLGLIHDLLTRGLDASGRLRDRASDPSAFKDSPLGSVPTRWSTPRLTTLCSYIGSGVTPRGGESVYVNSGVLFIRSQNVSFDGLRLEHAAFIPNEVHQGMLRSEVFAHDVLFNITGASIGRCCAMPPGLGAANVNQHVCILRVPGARECDATFLAAALGCPIGQRQLDALTTCGNRQGLNFQQLGSFHVPWPEADERKAIAAAIDSSAARVAREETELAKLHAIKAGVMEDLLSGRVSVPVPEAQCVLEAT